MARQHYIQAIADFTRAVFVNEDEPSYYWHRAEAYLAIADFDSCILNLRHFEQRLATLHQTSIYVKKTRMGLILYTWSQVLLDQRRFQEALATLDGLAAYGFRHSTLAVQLAVACIGLQSYDQAIHHLRQLTDDNPARVNPQLLSSDVYLLRAKLYYQQGKIFEAFADLKIAAEMNGTHPAIPKLRVNIMEHAVEYKNKASQQILKADLDLAVWYLNQAIELDPDDWKILLLRFVPRR
ncbi:Tetratricopeptide repeat protein 16 [Kappamyces sp. JEL0680]|nr:Tetratricopeptide repeat protein 16 [Kappamyces sp. JEL0680]